MKKIYFKVRKKMQSHYFHKIEVGDFIVGEIEIPEELSYTDFSNILTQLKKYYSYNFPEIQFNVLRLEYLRIHKKIHQSVSKIEEFSLEDRKYFEKKKIFSLKDLMEYQELSKERKSILVKILEEESIPIDLDIRAVIERVDILNEKLNK